MKFTPHTLIRRRAARLSVIGLVVSVALLLAGCATGAAPTASGSTKWTYTDALGHTVTLPERPTRIAGLNDVIVSLLEYGIKPVASFGYSSIADDQRFDGLDTKGITQVGTEQGVVNLEKLAEARPQLIVAEVYPTDEKGTIDKTQPDYGFKDMAEQQEIAKIAPIVTIYQGGSGADVVAKTTALASALGAKPSVIAAAKAKFDSATATLKAAASSSDVTVTAMYADSDGIDVAKPNDDPALRMYREDGVKFTSPTVAGYYWAAYSWENATKVGGDLILLEQSGYSTAELKKQPTFATNAALVAGQVQPWESSGMDYIQQSEYMMKLAGWISASKALGS